MRELPPLGCLTLPRLPSQGAEQPVSVMEASTPELPVDEPTLRSAFRITRVALALAPLTAGLLIALNAVVAWRVGVAVDTLERHELELVRSARILEREVPELSSDERGYLATGDPRFLRDFSQDRGDARDAISRLRSLVDTPEDRVQVETTSAQLERVIADAEQRLALAQQGELEQARAELLDTQRDPSPLTGALDTLVQREERGLLSRLDELQWVRLAGLALSVVLLLLVALVAVLLQARSQHALAAWQHRLRQAAAELREIAEARDQALKELQSAVREREELFTALSHDLKNPLTAIKGRADLLRREAQAPDLDTPRLLAGLAQIAATATRMTTLLDELLDAARLRSGEPLTLHSRPTDLVALARRVASDYQQMTGRHQITIESNEPSIVGHWDPLRLERVLGNLLGNALKYSPGGGVILVSVQRVTTADGTWASLSVRDPGIGIPAADVSRIFEAFQRGANVANRIPGTGIGLASALRIARAHGGNLTVESVEGAGSTFTLRLPLS